MLIFLLGFSILSGKETTDVQEVAKRFILKIKAPSLEAAKKSLVCLNLNTEQAYLECKIKAREEFLQTEWGQTFKDRAVEITSEDWINQEKRAEAIVKLTKTVQLLEPQVACANDPKAVDYTSCSEQK